MPGLDAKSWPAQLLHAGVVGGLAAGAFLSTHNEVFAAAVVVGGSRVVGECIRRWLPPRVGRAKGAHFPSPLSVPELRHMQHQIHTDAEHLVDRLSRWVGEVDFAVDDAVRRLTTPRNPKGEVD